MLVYQRVNGVFFSQLSHDVCVPGEEKNNKNNEGRSKFVVNVCLGPVSRVAAGCWVWDPGTGNVVFSERGWLSG